MADWARFDPPVEVLVYTIGSINKKGVKMNKWKSFITESSKDISNDVIEVKFVWKVIIQNIFQNSQINYSFDDYFESIIDVQNTKYG